MKSLWKASVIALFGLVALAPFASAAVIVRGGFGPVWVRPHWGPAYVYPYPYAYAYPAPIVYTGELKIKKADPGNSVYIDGAYVGLTNKVKDIPLPAGSHEVQVRDSEGRTLYSETVEIIAGRATEIQPTPNYQG